MHSIKRRIVDFVAKLPLGPGLLTEAARTKKDFISVLRRNKPWQTLEEAWPINLNIEVTNVCNANCVFCAYQYQSSWRSKKGILDRELFGRIVSEHARNGGKFVSLTPIVGEPLIDPRLLEKVRYVSELGLDVQFFTNGILLHRLDLDEVFASGLKSITVSTAPFEKEAFQKIYRNNRYEQMLAGLIRLLTARNERGEKLTVNLALRSNLSHSQTLSTPDFVKRVWPLLTHEERASINVMNSFDNWGGQIAPEDLLPGMRIQSTPRIRARPCKWTFIPMVAWDGLVRACACRFRPAPQAKDELVVGDLAHSSLTEIWNGQAVKTLRRSFVEGNVPFVCSNCPVYEPCK